MNHRLTVTAAAATVLASISLYPLITGTGWFFAGIGATIVVAGVGTLTRLRPLPVVVCFLAAVAGLFLYLNIVFAGPQSLYRLVPTPASVHHLMTLVASANTQTAKFAPPVPAGRGVVLLAAAGIGIVAAMTDLLAVRLRRPAIAGLPLLVLFCVPLTTIANPGWASDVTVFCLGIAGYLALLSAEGRERVRLWGRLVRTWSGQSEARGPDTRQLTAAGRRIGFATVVLALFAPLVLPALPHHRLFHGAGSGPGAGGGYTGSLSLPNPLVQMDEQLHAVHPETVLTYRTTSPDPPYLQVYVLGRLGKSDWSLAPPSAATDAVGNGTLPAVPGLTTATPAVPVNETITLRPTLSGGKNQVSYLPVPYAPRSLSVPGAWRVERNSLSVFSTSTRLAGLIYTVTSRDINPSPAELRSTSAPPAAQHGYLSVPAAFQQLGPLTRRITADRTSAYSKAVALQQWFTEPGNFTYSLSTTLPPGPNGLIAFVTKNRRGFCQQFAFAMAVMARLVGIPSRVVVGYTQGVFHADDTWVVRTSDAHAWPELYFKGVGWLRFEPTPSGSSGQAGQATASAPAYSIPPVGSIAPTPSPTASTPTPGVSRPGASPSAGGGAAKLKHPGSGGGAAPQTASSLPMALLIIVAVLAVAAVIPRAARSLTRRRRWFKAADDTGRAHAAWLEFRDDLTDHRIACRASESPRALARRLGTSLDFTAAQREALDRIALAEERARYARTPVASAQLRGDVATVRRAMARRCGLPARCAAALLPASALAPARAAVTHTLDVFGWMDVVTSGLRERMGRPAPGGPG